MEQNKSLLGKFLSLITYEEKEKPKTFNIPEINEGEDSTKKDTKNSNTARDTSPKDRKNRGLVKPIPLSEMNKEREETAQITNDEAIGTDYQSNIDYIRRKFNYPNNKDIVISEFTIARRFKAFIAYMDGVADRVTSNNFIIRPLLQDNHFTGAEELCQLEFIMESVIETNTVKKLTVPEGVFYHWRKK